MRDATLLATARGSSSACSRFSRWSLWTRSQSSFASLGCVSARLKSSMPRSAPRLSAESDAVNDSFSAPCARSCTDHLQRVSELLTVHIASTLFEHVREQRAAARLLDRVDCLANFGRENHVHADERQAWLRESHNLQAICERRCFRIGRRERRLSRSRQAACRGQLLRSGSSGNTRLNQPCIAAENRGPTKP